jgi:hypothetical protein
MVLRTLEKGAADPNFDGDGVALGVGTGAEGLVVESNGNVTVAGGAGIERFRPDGSFIDETDAPSFFDTSFHALVRQPDGKYVAGGVLNTVFGQPNSPRDFYLVRTDAPDSVSKLEVPPTVVLSLLAGSSSNGVGATVARDALVVDDGAAVDLTTARGGDGGASVTQQAVSFDDVAAIDAPLRPDQTTGKGEVLDVLFATTPMTSLS